MNLKSHGFFRAMKVAQRRENRGEEKWARRDDFLIALKIIIAPLIESPLILLVNSRRFLLDYGQPP